MDMKIAARMLVVLALVAAMTAAIMAPRGHGTEDAASLSLRHPGGEPARLELPRCRDRGMAALEDAGCQKAWAESRRRFLGIDGVDRPVTPARERFGRGSKAALRSKPLNPPVRLPVSP
jgi:conjugative transfer region protein TrbK